jgi:hypothetical protein
MTTITSVLFAINVEPVNYRKRLWWHRLWRKMSPFIWD